MGCWARSQGIRVLCGFCPYAFSGGCHSASSPRREVLLFQSVRGRVCVPATALLWAPRSLATGVCIPMFGAAAVSMISAFAITDVMPRPGSVGHECRVHALVPGACSWCWGPGTIPRNATWFDPGSGIGDFQWVFPPNIWVLARCGAHDREAMFPGFRPTPRPTGACHGVGCFVGCVPSGMPAVLVTLRPWSVAQVPVAMTNGPFGWSISRVHFRARQTGPHLDPRN